MTDNPVVVLLLGAATACAVAVTAVLLMVAGDLRRALRQFHCFLSHCDQTRLEAERALGVARQLLTRTDRAAGQIEGVVEKTCGAAEALLGQISLLKGKVLSLWSGHAGNGERRSRSRKSHRI